MHLSRYYSNLAFILGFVLTYFFGGIKENGCREASLTRTSSNEVQNQNENEKSSNS